MAKRNWRTDLVDIDYLLDSGLLYEINRSILHLFGIAITVKVDKQGSKSWAFKDCRAEPEKLLFDKATLAMGSMKLEKFLAEFGNQQDDRRCHKLGYGCQRRPRGDEK